MYEQLGSITCSKACVEDMVNMYNLIEPNITEDMDKRKLRKYIKYYVKLGLACVVKDGDKLVGFYAGKDTFIHYFICKGGPKAALLLSYTVICGIHNKYTTSKFIAFDSNKAIFRGMIGPKGKMCVVDEVTGDGEISPESKDYIEKLFNRAKRIT